MNLHTVFITHNRLQLTKQAVESYLETVSVPFSVSLVDNDSSDQTAEWIFEELWKMLPGGRHHLLSKNRYPGFAANLGWSEAPVDATHLHRADNDFAFLPGWCEEVERMFSENERLGQLGLRTDEEEQWAKLNVGGNCVIRRELWDAGLRYDERPWPQIREEVGIGFSEDSFLSAAVVELGWEWDRVERPCIRSLASGDWRDPYYAKSYGDRGITPRPDDPTAPGTT